LEKRRGEGGGQEIFKIGGGELYGIIEELKYRANYQGWIAKWGWLKHQGKGVKSALTSGLRRFVGP